MSTAARDNRQSSPIGIRNLQKSYGDVRALDNVSLEIETGEFITLLGPPEKSSYCREFFTNTKVVHASYGGRHSPGKAGP